MYSDKYLKYKNKYLNIKSQIGGNELETILSSREPDYERIEIILHENITLLDSISQKQFDWLITQCVQNNNRSLLILILTHTRKSLVIESYDANLLLVATRNNNIEIVKLLIKRNANIGLQPGLSILHIALRQKNIELIKAIFEYYIYRVNSDDVDPLVDPRNKLIITEEQKSLLKFAFDNELDLQTIKYLLEIAPSFGLLINTFFNLIIINNRIDILKEYIKFFDLNEKIDCHINARIMRMVPLFNALHMNRFNIFKFLIEHGANIYKQSNIPANPPRMISLVIYVIESMRQEFIDYLFVEKKIKLKLADVLKIIQFIRSSGRIMNPRMRTNLDYLILGIENDSEDMIVLDHTNNWLQEMERLPVTEPLDILKAYIKERLTTTSSISKLVLDPKIDSNFDIDSEIKRIKDEYPGEDLDSDENIEAIIRRLEQKHMESTKKKIVDLNEYKYLKEINLVLKKSEIALINYNVSRELHSNSLYDKEGVNLLDRKIGELTRLADKSKHKEILSLVLEKIILLKYKEKKRSGRFFRTLPAYGLLPVKTRLLQYTVGTSKSYQIIKSIDDYFEREKRERERLEKIRSDRLLEFRDKSEKELTEQLREIEEQEIPEREKEKLRKKLRKEYEKQNKRFLDTL